ncbi:hypothetical protein RRG08_003818, partial [Elysia crispata]
LLTKPFPIFNGRLLHTRVISQQLSQSSMEGYTFYRRGAERVKGSKLHHHQRRGFSSYILTYPESDEVLEQSGWPQKISLIGLEIKSRRRVLLTNYSRRLTKNMVSNLESRMSSFEESAKRHYVAHSTPGNNINLRQPTDSSPSKNIIILESTPCAPEKNSYHYLVSKQAGTLLETDVILVAKRGDNQSSHAEAPLWSV